MADGDYERRGAREAELGRLARLLAETRAKCYNSNSTQKKETDNEEGAYNRNHIESNRKFKH